MRMRGFNTSVLYRPIASDYFRSMSNKISIGVVLSQIDQSVIDGEHQTFSLRYTRLDGSLGEIKKARKNVKHPRLSNDGNDAAKSVRSFSHNIKESGVLLLYNEDKGGHREIKIDLISHFNGILVHHG